MGRMGRGLATSLACAGLCLGTTAAADPFKLSEAEVFFELNDTDGDLGIHASIDGDPYTTLEIEDPDEVVIFHVEGRGALRRQGLTQLDLESAEPSFDDLEPEEFFERFPEGIYEIEITRGRREAEAEVELSHVLAAPPSNVTVNGIPAAEDCDAQDLPVVAAPVLVDWDPVTESHPELGAEGDVEIVRYQFFTEQDDTKFSVDLPPTVTEFQVPFEITAAGGEFKYEIIARNDNGNNTAIESCFVVED